MERRYPRVRGQGRQELARSLSPDQGHRVATVNEGAHHEICGWICLTRSQKEPGRLSPHGADGWESLAGTRRARVYRGRRRRRETGQAHIVPAERQAEARRDGRLRLYRLQVPRTARPYQRQSDEGPEARENDGPEGVAFRRQAYVLGRVQGARRRVGEDDEIRPAADLTQMIRESGGAPWPARPQKASNRNKRT